MLNIKTNFRMYEVIPTLYNTIEYLILFRMSNKCNSSEIIALYTIQ